MDPIVASFSGGAVGVISALMLLEANNVKQQEKKRCKYCYGTGKELALIINLSIPNLPVVYLYIISIIRPAQFLQDAKCVQYITILQLLQFTKNFLI